jgi:hypothetical protein
MIDWLHDLGKDWGREVRRRPNGWPKVSLMGRIKEFGSVGAAIRTHEQVIPINDMPIDVLEWHTAWTGLEPRPKQTLYVFYVLLGSPSDKAQLLSVSKSTLYQRVTTAQTEIWSAMDARERFQKVQKVQLV